MPIWEKSSLIEFLSQALRVKCKEGEGSFVNNNNNKKEQVEE